MCSVCSTVVGYAGIALALESQRKGTISSSLRILMDSGWFSLFHFSALTLLVGRLWRQEMRQLRDNACAIKISRGSLLGQDKKTIGESVNLSSAGNSFKM